MGWVRPKSAGTGSLIATVQSSSGVAITSAGDAVLLTAPAIQADNNPIEILFTCEIADTAFQATNTVTLKLFRNGSEVDAGDEYRAIQTEGTSPFTYTVHWVDTTPGAAPVYDVRGVSGADNCLTGNRRLTVST